ncbi:flagellin N-terminal helical domain-containing protein [Ensifer adhaerens]|uniref:flagellin N-terminal helical domain-containing protein n=1 Tax=Ensifer adhaerens TaxID=106592 RepID=UPI000CF022C7|nr:flagellin [Ensifer adhaerens]
MNHIRGAAIAAPRHMTMPHSRNLTVARLMTSILTNTSAMSALSTIRLIGARLDDESQRLSSGLRVKTAADNAAYWSISTTMRSDVKAMGAVTDSIGLAMGIVDTAYAAMETVRQSFVEIRNLAITASDMPKPGMRDIVKPAFSLDPEYAKSDVYKIDVRIQQLQDQARGAMLAASFAGVNLLYHEKNEPVKASQQVFSFVIGYADGKVQTMDVSAMDTLLLNDDFGSYPTSYPGEYNPEKTLFDGSDIIDAPGTFTPAAIYWFNMPLSNPVTGDPEAYPVSPTYILQSIENHVVRHDSDRQGLYSNLVANIDKKIEQLTSNMAYVGSVQSALNTYDELNKKAIETATKGIGRLVDADMAVTSVKLRALEAQQQLAIQALGIANSEPRRILELFR